MLEWIEENAATIVAVIGFLIAGWKAHRRGALAAFLVERADGIATKDEKAGIKSEAINAGLEGTLNPIVRRVTKGDSGGVVGFVKRLLLPVLLLAVTGCALPTAGQATSPVDARFRIETLTFPAGQGTAAGPVTVTISQTVTITPTSTATQKADAKVDAKADVSGVPR